MEETENKDEYLGKDSIPKLLLRFGLPSVLSMLVAALYNIVDQIFIGQGVGYLGNSATNIVYPFTVLGLALALMVGDGTAALMSLSFGKKDPSSASKAAGNAFVLLLIISVLLTLSGFLFESQILWFFGATSDCYQYAKDYFDMILIGMPFYIISSALAGLIRADGSPRYAMISTVIGALINLALDPVAILYLKQGTRGAGITTFMGQIASCVMCLIYFFKPKTIVFRKESFLPEWKTDWAIIKLGVSSFIIQISIVIVMAVANKMINIYGPSSAYGADIPLAVIGIVMKVFGIVIAFGVGIAVGGQPILGYNYGAKDFARVNKTLFWILGLNFGIGLIAMLLFEVMPQYLIDIFGVEESAAYNEFAVLCFRIYLSGIALTCLQKAGSIFLQSIGKSAESTVLSVSRDVVFFVPGLILLSKYFGLEGMLYAAPLSDILSFILTAALLGNEVLRMKKKTSLALSSQH